MGKTLQVLGLMAVRPVPRCNRHLIVCPASVVPVWRNEIARWFGDWPVAVLKSGEDFRQERLAGVGGPGGLGKGVTRSFVSWALFASWAVKRGL